MPDSQATGGQLYTLTEVSRLTGLSMPTLQRYKKLYQNRIPAVGKGRKQRYPKEALPVFEDLKQENIKKRGRPRKSAVAAAGLRGRGRKLGGRKLSGRPPGGLLTLTQVGERTGISYPTLVRYVKMHGKEIPHEGRGRKRRYKPEAVDVFTRLRAESPRGRRKGVRGGVRRGRVATATPRAEGMTRGAERRIKSLEKTVDRLERKLGKLVAKLSRPRRVI